MKKILLISGLMLAGLNASADEIKWYGGVSYGNSKVDTGITNLTGTASLDEKDNGYKIFAGANVTQYISAELHYLDFGEATLKGNNGDTFDLGGTTYSFTSTETVTGEGDSYGISAIASYPMHEHFEPFVKVGLHRWELDYQIKTNNSTVSVDGTDIFYGIGANIPLTSNFSARIEYELFECDNEVEDITFLSAGLLYKF